MFLQLIQSCCQLMFDFLKTNVMWYYGWRRDEGKERIIFFTHPPQHAPCPQFYDTKICQNDDILTRSLSPGYYAISFWQTSSYSTSPTNSHNLNNHPLPPFFSFLCPGRRRRNATHTHTQSLTHRRDIFYGWYKLFALFLLLLLLLVPGWCHRQVLLDIFLFLHSHWFASHLYNKSNHCDRKSIRLYYFPLSTFTTFNIFMNSKGKKYSLNGNFSNQLKSLFLFLMRNYHYYKLIYDRYLKKTGGYNSQNIVTLTIKMRISIFFLHFMKF